MINAQLMVIMRAEILEVRDFYREFVGLPDGNEDVKCLEHY